MVTIDVDREIWKKLNARKEPGDSFNDVIQRVLDETQGTGFKSKAPQESHAGGGRGSSHVTRQPPADLPNRHDASETLKSSNVPGSQDQTTHRRAAILDLWEYLRDNGAATKSEFLELVDADAVDYASAESFWSNCIKGRETLKALPGVEPPAEGKATWQFQVDS